MRTGLPENGRSDADLLTEALRRAGGARALARFLCVTPGRISQLKGGAPMTAHARMVLEFALGDRRGFEAVERILPAKGSDGARSVRVEGDANVPAPLREAQGRIEFIFHTFGEDSAQWDAVVKMLAVLAPIAPVPKTVVTSPRPRGRARGRAAQQ